MGTSVLNQPQGNMRFLAIALLVSLAVLCSGKPSPKPKFFLVETKDKNKKAKYEEDPGYNDYLSKYQEGKDNYVKEEHDVYETTTTEKSYNEDDGYKKDEDTNSNDYTGYVSKRKDSYHNSEEDRYPASKEHYKNRKDSYSNDYTGYVSKKKDWYHNSKEDRYPASKEHDIYHSKEDSYKGRK